VTFNWFGFNTIIVTHLFELTFERVPIPIAHYNKMRTTITGKSGGMKQILHGNDAFTCGLLLFVKIISSSM
jgi:hypothetical protein